MAKASSTSDDVGLVGEESITSNGATTPIIAPEGRLLELAVSVPEGVTAQIEASYDAGATYFNLTPTSLSAIDATSSAKANTMQYFTEEPGVHLRVSATGFGVGDELTFRVSGGKKR